MSLLEKKAEIWKIWNWLSAHRSRQKNIEMHQELIKENEMLRKNNNLLKVENEALK